MTHTITPQQKGLLEQWLLLAWNARRTLEQVHRAVVALTGEEEEGYGNELCGAAVFNGQTGVEHFDTAAAVDELLNELEITVAREVENAEAAP